MEIVLYQKEKQSLFTVLRLMVGLVSLTLLDLNKIGRRMGLLKPLTLTVQ